MTVAAFVPDLMDRSRLRDVVDDFAPSLAALAESGADTVVVDLSRDGAIDAITALAPTTRVVAFGSHVHVELLDAARAAGAEVHRRSRFFNDPASAIRSPG